MQAWDLRTLLVSTYEMGRQSFGMASAAAFLRAEGHEVICADTALERLNPASVREADLIGFHLPMHTATRLASALIPRVREMNPSAHICCFGLYAPLNADYLKRLGAASVIGGEFEGELAVLAGQLESDGTTEQARTVVSLERLRFRVPDRTGLAPLDRYAALANGFQRRTAGYTEASRGCKHRCRHCPVVPVYGGVFRVVDVETVLADIRQQVASGAGHIAFGDPDFFNGPTHARRIVEALHREWPRLTYDVTIKIEHLIRHQDLLGVLARTGCVLVTSAVETLDDRVLALLEKNHTRADFEHALELCRRSGLAISPTFIPFTPWTTIESYRDLLDTLRRLDLAGQVAPVQLALRLLVPQGSRLLELDEVREVVSGFDETSLTHRWRHKDPQVDRLAKDLLALVDRGQKAGLSRARIFGTVWERAYGAPPDFHLISRAAVPYLTEPWYC